MKRRRFLTFAAGAALLPLTGCRALPRRGAASRAREAAALCGAAGRGVLTPEERTTLAAVCARILPSDEDPGAEEARVIDYIDQELAFTPKNTLRPVLQRSVKVLNQMARRAAGRPFVELAESMQDRILNEFGQRTAGFSGPHVFSALIDLTIEGFLCDPVYGGNYNQVGWKTIGFLPRSHGRLSRPYRVL